MSPAPPRRPSFRRPWIAGAIMLCLTAALVLAGTGPAAAQDAAAEAPVEAADAETAVDGGAFGAPPAPAQPVNARDRRRAMTETLWYMFFVTAGVLLGLVVIVWGLGWYKRAFLEEDPLQGELFDAAARAEIERHRKEVQAEHEAAKRAAETESTDADRDALPDGPPAADESPRETLSEQTAAPPDPAVQPDADAR
ncbi:hypothetical protein [Alienimonas sp. DA493]|uniref:hypothetical protein n=1 Tax=Alienimonas sp. DA493 TaxID=3373605 RepID=UPI0037544B78